MTAPPGRPLAGTAGLGTLAALLLVSLNLRSAIATVGPLLPQIRADLDLSATAAGLLTTLPLLCFAGVAPAASWLGRRVGVDRALVGSGLLLAAGTVGRVLGGPEPLLLGTFVAGAAMTVGNVLVPVVVKRDFGRRASSVTGLFTGSLAAGATVATATAAPLADLAGWRWALAVWALPAVAAAAGWYVVSRSAAARGPAADAAAATAAEPPSSHRTGVWRHPMAWVIALFLGAQSAAYYIVTAWLPTILVEETGTSAATAGVGASVFQVVGIAGTLLVPVLAGRRPTQVALGAVIGAGWSAGVLGLLLAPSGWLVWVCVAGLFQGAGISFAFTVMVLRAADPTVAAALSGMTQLVGYSLAAASPVAAGALYESTGTWTAALVALLAVTVALAVLGALSGRNRPILPAAPSRSS